MKEKLSDFDYNLPASLIAQTPSKKRDAARLFILDKKKRYFSHRIFHDLVEYLQPGDVLVLNNSKVFPARLIGHKVVTGGAVEIFLHQEQKDGVWNCLVGGRVRAGLEIKISTRLSAVIQWDNQDGTWQVGFNRQGSDFWREVNRVGEMPLPPYIKRPFPRAEDVRNYQTVYADKNRLGSAAAPTAGLHFTKSLLKKISARGVKIAYVTLHVGLGTFAPVKSVDIREHKMHSEFAEIKADVINDILATRKAGGRVIAVGTTSCRVLESLPWGKIKRVKKIESQAFWTDIFIRPGYKFQVVDGLITNFHLPKSTLLMLVSALATRPLILAAYREAIKEKYRFFSYGDAMFILNIR